MKHIKGLPHRLSTPNRVSTPRSRSTMRLLRNTTTGLCACPFQGTQSYPVAWNPLLPHPNAREGQSSSTSSTSSACQWSAEETVLAKQRLLEQSDPHKFGSGLLRTNLHDLADNPHSSSRDYMCQDYPYDLAQSHMTDHNPSLGRAFGHHPHHPHHTHHGKMGTDPTILLTLARWARIGASRFTGDDDQVDRINHQITSLILLLLVTLTGMRQYLSHLPLQCWIPQEFSRSWEEYAEHYCWVTNTYFANLQARLPGPNERPHVVRYYQWATFVLALQAFGFILPCFFWRMLQNLSGFHVQRIMRGAMQVNSSPATSIAPSITQLGRYMDAVIYHRHYKAWRRKGLREWCQVPQTNCQTSKRLEQANPITPLVPHSQTQSVTSLAQPSSSTKSVHFQSRNSFTLPGRKRENEQALTETGSLSNRKPKKFRAPSPPDSTKRGLLTPLTRTVSSLPGAERNSEPDLQPLAVRKKSSPKPYRSCCCINGFCPFKLTTISTRQTKTILEKSSSSLKQPDKSPKVRRQRVNQGSERQSRRNWIFTCCCLRSRSGKNPRPGRPSTHPRSSTCDHWKGSCKTISTWFLCLGRVLGALICLIPSCLCHWPSCCLGSKILKRNQAFLFYLYVTVKLFYVLNLIGQIYFMKVFLGADSFVFGFLLMRDLLQGQVWQQSGNFPRVTYCEFEAKKLGKNYKYTLQCVLPLNLFLEKVYVFLWFWMTFLTILTTYSLFKWLCRLSSERQRLEFIRKYVVPLKQIDDSSPENEQLLRVFTNKYLEHNGLLLLWLIATNAGDVVAAELTSYLWDTFIHRLVDHGSASPGAERHSVTFNIADFQGQSNTLEQPSADQHYSRTRCSECRCRYSNNTSPLTQVNSYCTVRLCPTLPPTVPQLGSLSDPASALVINHAGDHSRFGIDSSLDSIV